MEIPGFHEALSEVVGKYTHLAADPELTLFELERFVKKLKCRLAAKDTHFYEGYSWIGNEKPQNTSLR